MSDAQQMQIGEVAERTSLSLRTIRYYEEIQLVVPSARSAGGYRLYTSGDVSRLELVKRMKPLDFSLEEMRDLLDTLDRLAAPDVPAAEVLQLEERVGTYRELADQRVETLRGQLANAERFADDLARRGARHTAGRPSG